MRNPRRGTIPQSISKPVSHLFVTGVGQLVRQQTNMHNCESELLLGSCRTRLTFDLLSLIRIRRDFIINRWSLRTC